MKTYPIISLWFTGVCLSSSMLHGHEGHDPLYTEVGNSSTYQNEVTISEDGNHLKIQSNAIPAHSTGQFPTRGNPHAIRPQNHTFRIPLSPRMASSIRPTGRTFGIALNGVSFEPGTAETWNHDRNWRMEAIIDGKSTLGLDDNNAHVQPSGKYHYHGIPWRLIHSLSQNSEPVMVGWAADGFPIYYQKELKPSYQLKRGKREGGPGGRYDGTYTCDYEYREGLGDLDECNGKELKTNEFPDGTYAYFVTDAFPFVSRYFKGNPDASFMMPEHSRERGPQHRSEERGSDQNRGHRPPPFDQGGNNQMPPPPPPHHRGPVESY
ncbi:MAG: YHYH protein [Verrucomicrobiota bacterium]